MMGDSSVLWKIVVICAHISYSLLRKTFRKKVCNIPPLLYLCLLQFYIGTHYLPFTPITLIQANTGTTKSPARIFPYKALYSSIRICVISGSYHYHVTPYSVQYHVFINYTSAKLFMIYFYTRLHSMIW